MKRPVVPRAERTVFCERVRVLREADCTVLRRAGWPRCGRCFACDMGESEAALLRLSRH